MSTHTYLQTPSQTVGPYFAYGLTAEQYLYDYSSISNGNLIVNEQVKGERITISGQVWDGVGKLIPDAMIEIWQANSEGKYLKDRSLFHGFGRLGTGTHPQNTVEFQTIKPGSVNGQAPHINVIVFMRGLLVHAYTRLYFSDEAEANATDPVLKSIDPSRQQTLIANKSRRADGCTAYEFNIYMQGEKETVFFDV
ncbi:protocatechuate 3,4-dioxygenase subunit alpha [Rhodocytophaga aerolata]|uniref:Protocatechuate 3,4-dioxygenase subunit alpha n=1 Tax=Rhodocytophaga aerolata TaxID=455078 RepID=A0ABT8QZG6_9BACT|nr:protocatechuate 3,4-dioxygenase subunit alpha [Rhodocytophaga aerolata]MDO1445069.1 protocatechuate 3,4-dioxygenase subunit alpha [Rhodocytophaga aerolata]